MARFWPTPKPAGLPPILTPSAKKSTNTDYKCLYGFTRLGRASREDSSAAEVASQSRSQAIIPRYQSGVAAAALPPVSQGAEMVTGHLQAGICVRMLDMVTQ
ncbi:hypothetical protein BBK36DRAFT_1179735 [Trichoderma citrinoviride]|uniref:Uncharacterized protein n=1 Tax=Trichoderma citrinoviride TaxID=58853 RepID=A0A2T4B596_9HYPO|nr:hypothetical protein BBK36DRAFT_1179735 [Trichoderma citrinoviride]PTB64505.1 hypothetical protein BBK36DRAFT_1179735 [Trichoderma citrinoviride]